MVKEINYKPVIRVYDDRKNLKLTIPSERIKSLQFSKDIDVGDNNFSFELNYEPQVPIEISDYVLIQLDEDSYPCFVAEVLDVPLSNIRYYHQFDIDNEIDVIDDFQSYANDAALLAAWVPSVNGCTDDSSLTSTALAADDVVIAPEKTQYPSLTKAAYFQVEDFHNNDWIKWTKSISSYDMTDKVMVFCLMLTNVKDPGERPMFGGDFVVRVYSDPGGANEAHYRSDYDDLVDLDDYRGVGNNDFWIQLMVGPDFYEDLIETNPGDMDITDITQIELELKAGVDGTVTDEYDVKLSYVYTVPSRKRAYYPDNIKYYSKSQKYGGRGFYHWLGNYFLDFRIDYTNDDPLDDVFEDLIAYHPRIDSATGSSTDKSVNYSILHENLLSVARKLVADAGNHYLSISQHQTGYGDTPYVLANATVLPTDIEYFWTVGHHILEIDAQVHGENMYDYVHPRTGDVRDSGTSDAKNRGSYQFYPPAVMLFSYDEDKFTDNVDFSANLADGLMCGRKKVSNLPAMKNGEDNTSDFPAYHEAKRNALPTISIKNTSVYYFADVIWPGKIARIFLDDTYFDARIRGVTYSFDSSGWNIYKWSSGRMKDSFLVWMT